MKLRLRKYLPLFLTLLVLFAGLATGLAQEEDVVEPEAAEGHTILGMILAGGPLIMAIWVAILATSITMVTFIIQNFLQLRVDRLAPPPLLEALRQTIHSGNYQEAWATCAANNNYLANVVKAGLERLGRGKEAVSDAVADHALREAQILRTRNSYLSVIGVISPMIGLLGTVIGMMSAFQTLATSGIGDPGKLAGAIGEVLLATASGLFIAIPAFIFYYVFRNRSQMVIVLADDKINQLLQDIPYEELEGVQVGETFSAGMGAPGVGAAGDARKVSMALTTACPICNNSIAPGQNPCPHCGSTLQWEA